METSVPCSLITTTRLKPHRQRFNRIIMTIAESGHVYMELKGHVTGRPDELGEITIELIDISPDGKQVEVYQSVEGVPTIEGYPMPSLPDQVYTYPNMPDKLWKKYRCAYRFVELVKSRTGKIIMVTDRAECKLMENSPNADFQVRFSDGLTLMISSSKVTVTDKDGNNLTFNMDLPNSHVSPNILTLLGYSQQCRDQCLEIEKSVCSLQPGKSKYDIFPLTVGTRFQPFRLPSQPFLLPSKQALSSLSREINGMMTCDSPASGSLRGNIQRSQNCVNMEAKFSKRPEVCTELDDCIRFLNECQTPSENGHQASSELCADKTPCECCELKRSDSSYQSYETMKTKADQQYFIQPEPLKHVNSSNSCHCACQKKGTPLTCQKSNQTENYCLQSDCTKIQQHLFSQNINVMENQKYTEPHTLNCGNCKQFVTEQDLNGPLLDNVLVDKFNEECNISQHLVTSSYSCFDNKCTYNGRTESEWVPCCSVCQTNICDNNISKQVQSTFNGDIPDFIGNQLQNNFATPQKSTSTGHDFQISNAEMMCRCHKVSQKYNLVLDAEEHKQHLHNVRRKLFCNQSTAEVMSSSHHTYAAPTMQQDLLQFYNCSTNKNLAGMVPDEQSENLQFECCSSHVDNISDMPVSIPHGSVMTPSTKTQIRAISPLRYSESPAKKTYSPSLYCANDEHSCDNFPNSYTAPRIIIPYPAMLFAEVQTQRTTPEKNGPSPQKSAPVRKIASLSPQKIFSTEISIEKNFISEHTEFTPSDFFHRDGQNNLGHFDRSHSDSSQCQSPGKTSSYITESQCQSPGKTSSYITESQCQSPGKTSSYITESQCQSPGKTSSYITESQCQSPGKTSSYVTESQCQSPGKTSSYITESQCQSPGKTSSYITESQCQSPGKTSSYITESQIQSPGKTSSYITESQCQSPGKTSSYITESQCQSPGKTSSYITESQCQSPGKTSSYVTESQCQSPGKTSSYITESQCQSPEKASSYFTKSKMSSDKVFLPREVSASSIGNWSGMDLPLSPHIRKSLDMSSDGRSSSPSSGSEIVRQLFVPFTGWASLYTTGTIWILYHDGTQLGVKSAEAVLIFIDQDGNQNRYRNSDVLPDIVKLKLENLPKIIDKLMTCRVSPLPKTLM